MLRKLLVGLLPLLTAFTLASGLFIVTAALPTGTAEACNPCECPGDLRANCQGIEFYGVFTRGSGAACNIDAFRFNAQGQSRRVFRATRAEIAAVPEFPAVNTLIEQNDAIALYRLTSGEFQVNAGPDGNGKVYVLIFNNCPAENRRESSFIP